jgi:hypothetical protein
LPSVRLQGKSRNDPAGPAATSLLNKTMNNPVNRKQRLKRET